LSESDLDMLRAFALKVEDNLSAATFGKMRYAFPRTGLDTLDNTKARMSFLSGFKAAVRYDCCINSCICYTGPYADLTECPHCHEARRKSNGEPRKYFSYMPLIPRLSSLFSNRDHATRMRYRAHEHMQARQDGKTTDIFDGIHYRTLLGQRVTIDETKYAHTYFSDGRDVALGFAIDGFAPFRKRKLT
ncbi:hypothetical protein FA95DRAFT_1465069, partial [Auriscalpium vulgare]